MSIASYPSRRLRSPSADMLTSLSQPFFPSDRGFVYAKNKVPEYQKMYHEAFKNHTRVWKIVSPGSREAHMLEEGEGAGAVECKHRRGWAKRRGQEDQAIAEA